MTKLDPTFQQKTRGSLLWEEEGWNREMDIVEALAVYKFNMTRLARRRPRRQSIVPMFAINASNKAKMDFMRGKKMDMPNPTDG